MLRVVCQLLKFRSIGAAGYAVLIALAVLWPLQAKGHGWTLPETQSGWGTFALGFASGLGGHELGHYAVARSKGYTPRLDGLSIVYPDETLVGADRLQVSSAGFQAQWLMTEFALRDSNGRELKSPPGDFAAGVVCAHLGVSLAYLTFLRNHKQGDVHGMSEATGLSKSRIAATLAIPAALDAWRLFGNDVPGWVPQVSLLGKGLGVDLLTPCVDSFWPCSLICRSREYRLKFPSVLPNRPHSSVGRAGVVANALNVCSPRRAPDHGWSGWGLIEAESFRQGRHV